MAKGNEPKPVIISPQAKEDIAHILSYLSQNRNQKVIDEFLQKLPTVLLYYLHQSESFWIL
jgi:plasmid stabilization system protein ParE